MMERNTSPGRHDATLLDVAERAGVSRATASLVLRDTGRVSEATRQRVREAMAEVGYVYNRSAAAMRSNSTKTIGILVTHIGNPFFGELVGGLQEALGAAGYSCILASSGDDAAQQDRAIAEMRSHKVSAVAIAPATTSREDYSAELRALNLPHVMITRHSGDLSAPFVGPDNVLGGRLAMAHLIEHGAQSFAYIGGSPAIHNRTDRRRGMHEALASAGIARTALIDLPSETGPQDGLAAGFELIDEHPLPDAILCHSDSIAFGVYRALRIRGLSSAVRVTGYDDIAFAELWEPPLTTISTRPAALGERAAQHLLKQIEHGVNDGFVNMPPRLVVRESCGCTPQHRFS